MDRSGWWDKRVMLGTQGYLDNLDTLDRTDNMAVDSSDSLVCSLEYQDSFGKLDQSDNLDSLDRLECMVDSYGWDNLVESMAQEVNIQMD